jgi:hypothetical protein
MQSLIHQARKAYGSHKAAYTAIGVSHRAWYYYAKGHPMPLVVERSIRAHLALLDTARTTSGHSPNAPPHQRA